MHAARIDAEVFAQQITKARRVQNGAGADHALVRQPGDFPRRVGEHIDRIGGDHDDAVGIVLRHLRNDLLEDAGILLHQVEPRLARFLRGAGGDHRHGRPGAIGVVPGPDAAGREEGHGVIHIHRFALGARAVRVDQHDFRGRPLCANA